MDYKQILYLSTASELPGNADDGQLAFVKDSQSTVTFAKASGTWMPLGRSTVFRSSVQVNAKNTGNSLILTLPANPLFFYPTGITIRQVNVAGGGTNPAMTVGTNGPNYNNIATSSLISSILGLLDVNNGVPIMATFSPPLAGGSQVYLRVTAGALLYTNFTIKMDLHGYYDSVAP